MFGNVKIRIGNSKELNEFDTRDEAFSWVRSNNRSKRCIFSVLTYEYGELEDMSRWYFDGKYFKREDIRQ